MRILIDENMPVADRLFADLGELVRLPGRQMTAEQVADADVLLVRSVTRVDAELLARAQHLKFVGTATIGTDHIDQALLTQRGIAFSSAPGCNKISVGEYVISALLVLAERYQLNLAGMTLGIIGAGNTGSAVAAKAQAALSKGVTPIVCVGETLAEREAGQTEAVVKRQLAAVIQQVGQCVSELVVAYEPVWAIGTGKTASPEQAQQVHAVLRAQLAAASAQADRVPLLYGGSMNAANAAQLLAQADIDGGLIGGAALKAPDFLTIIAAAQ